MSLVSGPFQKVDWEHPSELLLPCLPGDWKQLCVGLRAGSHQAEWYHQGGEPQGLLVYKVATKASRVLGECFVQRIELFSATNATVHVLLNRIADLASEHLGSKFTILTPNIGRIAFGRMREALFRLRIIKDPRGNTIKFKHTELDVCKTIQTAKKKHELAMIGVHYFDYIMQGEKPYEGRVNGAKCRAMKIGDLLEMVDSHAGWGILCEITALDTFETFMDMLKAKSPLKMLPQLKPKASLLTSQQLLKEGEKIYKSFPGSVRVKKFGAVAIGVKFIKVV